MIPHRTRPLVVLLLVAGLLSLLVADFFRQVIFIPLLQLFLAAYLLYRALPQNLVWGALVVFAVVVATRALWPRRPVAQREETTHEGRGRVAELAALAASESDYDRWQLLKVMEELALEIGRTHEGPPPREVRALLEAGAAIPNYGRFIELRRQERRQTTDERGIGRLRSAIPQFFGTAQVWRSGQRPWRSASGSLLADLDLDKALAAIESWLEPSAESRR